jgi:hypothetical protein
MKTAFGAAVIGFLACVVAGGQSQHTVPICGLPQSSNCYLQDSSTIGGLRYEDYKVTNPLAVQFDPAQRLRELSALGTSTTDTMCKTPPVFTSPAPTITFDKTSVAAQI